MIFLILCCENPFQHWQLAVVALLLGLLVVLLTDMHPILCCDELAHDGVGADAADKAVRMVGDSIDSEGP